MKKLNITKERFEKSKYFQDKYGKLKYVSESGNYYKTDKGQVIKFNESFDIEEEVWEKWKRMSDEIEKKINFEEVARNVAKKYFPRYANEIATWLKNNIELIFTNGYAEDWTGMENCPEDFANHIGIQISDMA